MSELLCSERMGDTEDEPRAEFDPVLMADYRVLQNMLALQHSYMPKCDYFKSIQSDLEPYMRKVVADWMLEVCEEQHCEDQVFSLALNFVDRFLCTTKISRQQFQLLGAVSLLTASKLRQCRSLNSQLMIYYTDYSITLEELKNWELLLLSRLKWDLSAVTAFDFVDVLLERLGQFRNSTLRRHCHTFISLAVTDPEMIGTLPSIVASSAITVAMRGLALHLKVSPGVTSSDPVACLASIVQLPERKQLESTVSHVEGLIARRLAGVTSPTGVEGPASPRALPQKGSGNGEAPEPSLCHGKHNLPDTPTDVTEVEF